MAHFAEIGPNNFVRRVVVVDNDKAPDEITGAAYLASFLGGEWKQTSYNTRGGVHYGLDNEPDGKPQFRYNYAGQGYTYDTARDAFIPPCPGPGWTLDEATCLWVQTDAAEQVV